MRDRNKLSERQRNILKFMETYLEAHGFPPTIREIGNATGIKSTSVVNYNLNKLVSAGYLSRASRASRGIRLVKNSASGSSRKGNIIPMKPVSATPRIPIVGQIVASEPVAIPDDMGQYFDEDRAIEVPQQLLAGFDQTQVFALRVKGDSMMDAMIRNGDIVVMKKQETARDGEMVAVWLDGNGETTLKYFYREGDRVRLQPAHPSMEPIYVNANQCHVQGRVLGVMRLGF